MTELVDFAQFCARAKALKEEFNLFYDVKDLEFRQKSRQQRLKTLTIEEYAVLAGLGWRRIFSLSNIEIVQQLKFVNEVIEYFTEQGVDITDVATLKYREIIDTLVDEISRTNEDYTIFDDLHPSTSLPATDFQNSL